MIVEFLVGLGCVVVYGLLPAVMLAGLISSLRHGQPNLDQPWTQRADWRHGGKA